MTPVIFLRRAIVYNNPAVLSMFFCSPEKSNRSRGKGVAFRGSALFACGTAGSREQSERSCGMRMKYGAWYLICRQGREGKAPPALVNICDFYHLHNFIFIWVLTNDSFCIILFKIFSLSKKEQLLICIFLLSAFLHYCTYR